MLKNFINTLIASCLIFVFIFNANVFASDLVSNYSYSKSAIQTKNNLKVTGYIPTIKNLTNPIFQNKLNTEIIKTYNNKVSSASGKGIKTLRFSYDIVVDNDIISIILYSTNMQTSASEIETFVINKSNNTYAGINTILGNNGINYANKVVENEIRQEKNIKYFGVSTITDETPFYVKDKNVVVMFGAGSIAAVSKGVRSFVLVSSNIKNLLIPQSDYYLKSAYNVKMIPLRTVTNEFGYFLKWNPSNNSIIISKSNFSCAITIARNSYSKGRLSPSALEFAPEIKNGITYVPISFFAEILGLLFAVDSNGNVTVSEYSLNW